jgi:MtaA/CmuA family methyltransferase
MTSRERVLAALERRPVDHLAALPITMMFAADSAGVPYRAYASDHRVLAEAQIQTAESYQFDYVSAISDPAREVADLGGVVEWFDDQPPAVVESRAVLADRSRLATLSARPWGAGSRMGDRIDGVALLKQRSAGRFAVEGWVEGPCALAADLRGLNALMLDFADEPGFVQELFAFATVLELGFAREQIAAGADLIGMGDAAASLIGPRRYAQFVVPYERSLIHGIHDAGAKVRLHICGNTRKLLADMGTVGADLIDLDFFSPMGEARAAMGSDQPLLGNLDPVRLVRDGTPDSIRAELANCFSAAGPHYLVGAGCEIPRGTPPANVRALTEFARATGGWTP